MEYIFNPWEHININKTNIYTGKELKRLMTKDKKVIFVNEHGIDIDFKQAINDKFIWSGSCSAFVKELVIKLQMLKLE